MEQIELGGQLFFYIIVRKHNKNLYIRWRDDHFVVTTPFLCSKKKVEMFFKLRQETLLQMTREKDKKNHLSIVNGQKIQLLSKKYEICFSNSTRVEGNVLYLKGSDPLKSFFSVAKKELSAYVEPVFQHYFQLMYGGMLQPRINYRVVKTYFGQYNRKSYLITFNILLALVDPYLIDYVVVHELAHIKYLNHQADFKALEEKYMADYKLRQKRLKQEAILL